MDPGKSAPSQSPPIQFIKASATVIAPILSKIFNKCFLDGEFPRAFKFAEVVPIFKSGDKSNVSNYRPISLLCPFAKLLEKCINSRLIQYFTKNKSIYSFQFGFRENCSTENAVLQIYDQLCKNCDINQISCSVLLDLRKAFDTVNHAILIDKSRCYGVRGVALQLLISFFTNRKQYTTVRGCKSTYSFVNCGVPQGSILGPILFLIYINDLYLATTLRLNLFADDAYISGSNSCPVALQNLMNSELEKVFQWLNTNKLSLNAKKTSYMIFSKNKKSENFQIKIGNDILSRVHQAKYLGVIIDDRLNWKPHVAMVRSKMAKGCWAISRLRKFVSSNVLIKVYYGLVYSHIIYCISCWGWIAKCNLNSLTVLQKRAIRIISRVPRLTHTSPLFHKLGLLKIADIYTLQISKIMYKYNSNDWLGSYEMATVKETHSHFTRFSISNYYSPLVKSRMSKGTLSIVGPKIWSTLPNELKSLPFAQFKIQLKNHLIKDYDYI